MKKTSISSIVCLDIIDYAKKSPAEQQANKQRLDEVIALAVVDIPKNDRLIVDTGHGAVITCSGPLENALEDALFIALTIRDEVLNTNAEMKHPLHLLIGINLGSAKAEDSLNTDEPPNIVGEGLAEAQKIMSFANPNQILVSRAYYDMASKLTLEVAQMFEKYDMHAYEHDIYAVRLLNEKGAATDNTPITDTLFEKTSSQSGDVNWQSYLIPIILALIMLFALTKWMNADNNSESNHQPAPETAMPDAMDSSILEDDSAPAPNENDSALQEAPATTQKKDSPITDKQPDSTTQKNTATKKATKKETSKQQAEPNRKTDSESAKETDAQAESNSEATRNNEKSTWDKFTDSVKQGTDNQPCTQGQKALNQCN